MQVGVFYFPTDYGIDIAELAQALVVRPVSMLPAIEVPDLSRDEILRLLDNHAPLAAAG